jgi:hypothetical protein
MSPFLVIAYYTPGNPYPTLSENLKKSCKEFNLPLFLKPIEDLGSWERNTHYKAKFIKECLDRFLENLVYVDVDAEFKEYPDLFESIECDIAYRTENFRWRANEALSGTIFLKNHDNTRKLIDAWISINESNPAHRNKPDTWEQANLQRAVSMIPEISYKNLPPEYTYIFDHTKAMYPNVKPVIEHYQASRKIDRK